MSTINRNEKKVQSDAYQLHLRVVVDKEVDIYIAAHPTYLPYQEELKREVYTKVIHRIPENKPTTYLKKAARNTLFQQIRDISDKNRNSNIRFLASAAPKKSDGTAKKESQDDYCERCAHEAGMLGGRSPHDILVGKETEQLIEQLLNQGGTTLRTLIEDPFAGISIRDSARKLGLSKSTAFDIISKFKGELIELLG